MTDIAGADTLVIAFGGVAAFSPPVAFYLACVRVARERLGVGQVRLAFADRSNPCVTAVEMALRAQTIPVSCRCANAWPDSVHLVVSGPGLPSPYLRTLFAFRDIEQLREVGRGRDIRLFVGLDTVSGYPAAAAWDASLAQRSAAMAYAEDTIIVADVTASNMPLPLDDVGRMMSILAGRDGPAVLAEAFATHFSDAPDRETLRQAFAALRDPDLSFPAVATADPRALLWLDVITTSRAQRRGGAARVFLELGREYDFIEAAGAPPAWIVWQWLGVLALRHIQPTHTVGAMVTTRNEGINLLEWVAHYQAIGVERIFVYTNDNDDGSVALLTALAKHNIITLVIQHSELGYKIQRRTLQHALLMLPELRDCTWVLFVDADEYAVPDATYDHRLDLLLAEVDRLPDRPGALLLPWRARRWPHCFERPIGMTLANYQHAVEHELTKAAVRPAVATSMIAVHVPDLDAGVPMVDTALAALPMPWSDTPKSDMGGRIEHIWARSFTDFVIKRERGYRGGLREFDRFYQYNGSLAPDSLRPIEPVVIERTSNRLVALRAIPEIAAAQAEVEAIYAARVAAIAADPDLRAIFAAQPNPN